MKVVFFLDNYWPHIGGVENAFKNLCEGLARRGHDVTVIVHRPRGIGARETVGGVKIVRMACLHSRYAYTFALLLWVVMTRPKADIIQTTTFNAAPAAWLAGRLRRIPVVMTINETWIGKWTSYSRFSTFKAALHDSLERAVFSLPFSRYVAISQATADRVRDVIARARGRLETITYGFDPTRWKAAATDATIRNDLGLSGKFVVLGYGRPGTSKGFEWFVDAIPEIERAIPNLAVVLILSDDDQYARELQELKDRADGRVIFLSPRSYADLPAYVKSADCVVVPSLAEGFGYTTLEAVATGVPVVASRVGSIPEVIGGRYVLVEPRDGAALAGALVSIASGTVPMKPERSFPWSETIDRYEALYERLTSSARSASR